MSFSYKKLWTDISALLFSSSPAYSVEMEKLNREIAELQNKIAILEQENGDLSKRIHKDNKLIPAMEQAVMTLTDMAVFPNENTKKRAEELRASLNALYAERTGIQTDYHKAYHRPSRTGVAAVDAMCQYMERKALEMGIRFQFTFLGSVKYLTENLIHEDKLTTLIADLAENALISMKKTDVRSALFSLRIENNIYVLSIYDSGTAFQPEIIRQFGITRATTHQNDGGSGIGLMTLYEILKECRASYLLDETIQITVYTKAISIYFDGLSEIRINSRRPEIMALQSVRTDFVFLS